MCSCFRLFSNLKWIFLLGFVQFSWVVSAQQPIDSSTVMEVALAPENSMLTISCPETCSLRLYDATYKELCPIGSDADCSRICPVALNAISTVRNTCAAQAVNQCMLEVTSKTLRRPCSVQQSTMVHLIVSYRCEECTTDNLQPVRIAVEPAVMTSGGSGGSAAAVSIMGMSAVPTLTLGASGTVRSFCGLSQLAFVRALCNSYGKLTLPSR